MLRMIMLQQPAGMAVAATGYCPNAHASQLCVCFINCLLLCFLIFSSVVVISVVVYHYYYILMFHPVSGSKLLQATKL